MSRSRVIAVVILVSVIVAAAFSALYVFWDRPLEEVQRLQIVVHVDGGRAAIGDRPLAADKVGRTLGGNETEGFHLRDEGSPSELVRQGIRGEVIVQPPWENYGDLKVYRRPHLFEEPLTVVQDGKKRYCWLVTFRHGTSDLLQAIPVWVDFGVQIPRWTATDKSVTTPHHWWDEKVLKQQVQLLRIELFFAPGKT